MAVPAVPVATALVCLNYLGISTQEEKVIFYYYT